MESEDHSPQQFDPDLYSPDALLPLTQYLIQSIMEEIKAECTNKIIRYQSIPGSHYIR